MTKVSRGSGGTASERYLAQLADRTFLNLWSYPNAFNDRGIGASGIGKELCDLLVVCGDDVVIFSDKSVAWPGGSDTHLSWARWYRRAVEHSVKQLRGAERWLSTHPNRVFIDPKCTTRLPATLPPPERMRVHLIAVALGAQAACSRYFRDRDGSLMVATDLQGNAHTDPKDPLYRPFCFGDVEPEGSFVHVFDETALNLVLREMDTVSDFVRYLGSRAMAVRGQFVHMAASEAEMLAYYLAHEDDEGAHLFPIAIGPEGYPLAMSLVGGSYAKYVRSDAFKAKREADRISYAWDRLITTFSDNVLAGTSVAMDGSDPLPQHAERALRGMALENRTTRRVLAEAFIGALREAEKQAKDRFARVVLPQNGAADPECAYLFLVMAFRPEWLVERGYDDYRKLRTAMLTSYGDAILYDNRQLKRVIGIGIDASSRVTGKKGGSEDVMLLERLEWSPEAEQQVATTRKELEILLPGNVRHGHAGTQEFPIPLYTPVNPSGRNRQQRRAANSRARRQGR